ncbi:hypothetical protein Syun_023896 [Stephania yunnanensis]|uniref:Dynamin GTPase domain-containing protein n=1 Tax=Stephania yunnanensis TaxID=152371 RepID=A0AAP0FDK5_9MAGN
MKISIKYSTDVLVPYHPVVNLTMIDLPGLTKVVIEGQPDSILQEIENMVRSFIEKVYTLCIALKGILAFTTFWRTKILQPLDAIKISREVDPKGERTFGVLTKIDLMDKGTNAVDILEGKSYRLQFPWIGVVNRSQADSLHCHMK